MKPNLSREMTLNDGRVATKTGQQGYRAFGPWQPMRQRRLATLRRANNQSLSMIRRGNCWDKTVAESFFSPLKKERINKRIYKTRDLTRADIFDYIEMFYYRTRYHTHLGRLSPKALRTGLALRTEYVYRCGVKCQYAMMCKLNTAPQDINQDVLLGEIQHLRQQVQQLQLERDIMTKANELIKKTRVSAF